MLRAVTLGLSAIAATAWMLFDGCVTPATEIMISLGTDAPATRGMTVRVTAFAGAITVLADAGARDASVRLVADAGSLRSRTTFAVIHAVGESQSDRVTLVFDVDFAPITPTSSAVHVRRVVRTMFVPHTTFTIPVFFSLACARAVSGCATVSAPECTQSVLCGERPGETCGNDGTCISDGVIPLDAGTACGAGTTPCDGRCVSGACVPDCPSGQTACGGACVDLQISVSHCGRCGNVCVASGSPATCVAGVCGGACPSGQTRCATGCSDLGSDVLNCGACGNVCAPGAGVPTCSGRSCGSTCSSGQTACSGACKDLQSDTSNCGACGHGCSAPSGGSASCSGGNCGQSCSGSDTLCSGSCYNLSNDSNHCGSCGASCGGGGVSRSCSSGRCVPDCGGRVDGLYCGNNMLGADSNTLFLCLGGSASQSWGCSHGCQQQASGVNDNCVARCTGQPNGAYCGNDGLGSDPNTLFNCSGGNASVRAHCVRGCHTAPAGTDDYCS